ncbi:penicillin-binding protein activator LpoB [Persicobacter psychrovividus]|uniref:Penicillin-binding protein activator LpoB n=1 Tax=Persicobacter psychrovividus TaxID=387638 RepID=A0ABN6L854_9BACT|nr:penicillin-binding protein activator LpoB [Persicobacter psychrovividus]
MKLTLRNFLFAAIVATLAWGCQPHTVTRVSPDQQIDLSGRWNDTDSRMVAQEMISDVMTRPWAEEHLKATGKKPVVIIGAVKNKTAEHIDPEVFIKDMEKEFINSGRVRVVQDASFREKLREERADQSDYASKETAKGWGKELGADYMMFGVMTAVTDQYGKKKLTNYKVNLELVNLETNEKVWLNDKEIKKYINN